MVCSFGCVGGLGGRRVRTVIWVICEDARACRRISLPADLRYHSINEGSRSPLPVAPVRMILVMPARVVSES